MAFHPQQPLQQIPAYGYCDSYFVENHDEDGIYARAAMERERAQDAARIKQKALAIELSQVTAEEYQVDVLKHMERMEAETMPDIQSIEIQTEIQWFMRPYLLDFLLEAHHAFRLLPETLHLAVNLLDRYCSRRVVYKRHYQLVGCAALLIAAKYGDRKDRVPTIRELKSMCCSLYDDDMFTQMEWHVLQTLNWIIGHPTVTGFLQLALTETTTDPELEHMAWYLTELALYHKDFIPVRPSAMATSALVLARCILGRPQRQMSDWSTRYDPQVVLNLSNYLTLPSQALVRKYSTPLLSSVSTTVDMFLRRQAMLQRANHNIDHRSLEIEPRVPSSTYLNPQTPQKSVYPGVPADVPTPPITPESSFCCNDSYAGINVGVFPQSLFPRVPALCTPTRPRTADQPTHITFAPTYIQHPQFVSA